MLALDRVLAMSVRGTSLNKIKWVDKNDIKSLKLRASSSNRWHGGQNCESQLDSKAMVAKLRLASGTAVVAENGEKLSIQWNIRMPSR